VSELPINGLTKEEAQLFYTFEQTAVAYEVANSSIKIFIRVVGGWVRDHLLQMSSNDIALYIASLSGVELATLLLEYLSVTGETVRKLEVVCVCFVVDVVDVVVVVVQ